jgi:hypothetical protein
MLTVAILSAACAARPPHAQPEEPPDYNCAETTTVGKVTVTLEDGRAIRDSVIRLLQTTKLADPVPLPADPFIDCWGTMRMGPWVLEEDDEPDLRLSYTIARSDYARNRQEIRITRVDGRWKAVNRGIVHYFPLR